MIGLTISKFSSQIKNSNEKVIVILNNASNLSSVALLFYFLYVIHLISYVIYKNNISSVENQKKFDNEVYIISRVVDIILSDTKKSISG